MTLTALESTTRRQRLIWQEPEMSPGWPSLDLKRQWPISIRLRSDYSFWQSVSGRPAAIVGPVGERDLWLVIDIRLLKRLVQIWSRLVGPFAPVWNLTSVSVLHVIMDWSLSGNCTTLIRLFRASGCQLGSIRLDGHRVPDTCASMWVEFKQYGLSWHLDCHWKWISQWLDNLPGVVCCPSHWTGVESHVYFILLLTTHPLIGESPFNC